MQIYEKNGLHIQSDMEIRVVRESQKDVDLLIPLDNRTVNLYLGHTLTYISQRLQIPMVRSMLIRFSLLEGHNICTIHMLKNIDLNSSMVNFEMNFAVTEIRIEQKEFWAEVWLDEKRKHDDGGGLL